MATKLNTDYIISELVSLGNNSKKDSTKIPDWLLVATMDRMVEMSKHSQKLIATELERDRYKIDLKAIAEMKLQGNNRCKWSATAIAKESLNRGKIMRASHRG
jgi:hypothetical protein